MTATLQRIVLSPRRLHEARRFYVDILGLVVEWQNDPLAVLRTADGVELMLHERDVPRGDTVSLGFAVRDLDDAVARWTNAGGTVIDAPEQRPWGERMAVVRDLDGNLVCLSQAGSG